MRLYGLCSNIHKFKIENNNRNGNKFKYLIMSNSTPSNYELAIKNNLYQQGFINVVKCPECRDMFIGPSQTTYESVYCKKEYTCEKNHKFTQ